MAAKFQLGLDNANDQRTKLRNKQASDHILYIVLFEYCTNTILCSSSDLLKNHFKNISEIYPLGSRFYHSPCYDSIEYMH